jgi:alpha-glucosidase
MEKRFTLTILMMLGTFITLYAEAFIQHRQVISSPDGRIVVLFAAGDEVSLTVKMNGTTLFSIRKPGMLVNQHNTVTDVVSMQTTSMQNTQHPVIREKRALVADHYRELTIKFRGEFSMVLRVYNDGFAYRFVTRFHEDSVTVISETGDLLFSPGDSMYIPLINCRDEPDVDCFHTSFEEDYVHTAVGDVSPGRLAYLPFYVRLAAGASMAVTESDLWDYPGMFVSGSECFSNALALKFPAFPLSTSVRGDFFKQELVIRRADYIAKTAGSRDYPWRVFIIGENDRDLVNADMVYRLASSCKLEETGWIRPGKITDEWIINSILYGVDFRSGINTATYKYYIDFARCFGLEYIFMDAGWSEIGDLYRINPDVDMAEIIRYADESNVAVWLWTSSLTMKHSMEILKVFRDWGIKGIMVDFMDREDQLMVRFLEKVARETAENQLMVLFHGAPKPMGLRKAYPNVIIRESVAGHEFDKWTDRITPEHNLIIPFTRMIAGPLDYEGGCMINAAKSQFRIIDPVPMSQGTRIHQLAMYVVYECPLQFLAGNICDYLREPEYAVFFGKIPTTWDETIVLEGKISDYILVARKSGSDWWVGAMSDWTQQTLKLDLFFLDKGTNYRAEIYCDGVNANRYGADYRVERKTAGKEDTLEIIMAPGGGWVAHFHE